MKRKKLKIKGLDNYILVTRVLVKYFEFDEKQEIEYLQKLDDVVLKKIFIEISKSLDEETINSMERFINKDDPYTSLILLSSALNKKLGSKKYDQIIGSQSIEVVKYCLDEAKEYLTQEQYELLESKLNT